MEFEYCLEEATFICSIKIRQGFSVDFEILHDRYEGHKSAVTRLQT